MSSAVSTILGDDDTLAGSQAVGLDDQRVAPFVAADRRERVCRRRADREPGGGDVVARHEILGKRLTRFQLRRRSRGSDNREPAFGKDVDDAGAQRLFRTDHRQSHVLTYGYGRNILWSAEIGRDTAGDRRDARIARDAENFGDIPLARQFPRHGVLTRAATDNE